MNKWILAALALIAGAAIGHYGFQDKPRPVASQAGVKKPLYFRNPMNPEITSPVPAKDDMGMDFIPVYAEGEAEKTSPGAVRIDPAALQDMGVRTVQVRRGMVTGDIRTVGRVAWDEEGIRSIHAKYSGWVSKLYADKTGQPVKKGAPLLSIYSPQVVSTQQEYLLALENEKTLKASPFPEVREGAARLLESTGERLRLFDMPPSQIVKLSAKGAAMKDVFIDSPASGVVTRIGAREGDNVTPATELFAIADLSKVWVLADLYESDVSQVKEGDTVSLGFADFPGRDFSGKIAYLYPYLDAKTRTVKARIVLDNPGMMLKPEMYADVVIHSGMKRDALVLPVEAVVRTGTRNLVYVQLAPGRFEPREVKLGLSSGGNVEILAGLPEGQKVAVSGVFLIDSDSRISAAAAKKMQGMKTGERK